jgi:hypothetical protein
MIYVLYTEQVLWKPFRSSERRNCNVGAYQVSLEKFAIIFPFLGFWLPTYLQEEHLTSFHGG